MSEETQYRIKWKSIPAREDVDFLMFDLLHLWSDSGNYIAQLLIQSDRDDLRAIHTRDGCLSPDALTKIKQNIRSLIEEYPYSENDDQLKSFACVIQRTPRYFESGASLLYPDSCIKQKMFFENIINDLHRTIFDNFIAELNL